MTRATRRDAATSTPQPSPEGFSLISNQKLLDLYSTMLKCRMIEERLHSFARKSKVQKTLDVAGREAAIVGVAIDLAAADMLAPSHRALIPCFAKGLPLAAVFSSLSAAARPPFARLRIVSPSLSLAAQLGKAIRAAAAAKAAKNKRVAVAFCGSSSDSPAVLLDAMARAGAEGLPILFVCHTANDAEGLSEKVQDYDFPGIVVDSHDAVAVYRVATEALAHARRGSGPTLIECKPWPLPSRKADPHFADPILNMETYLTRKGLFTPEFKAQVAATFKHEIAAALKSIATDY